MSEFMRLSAAARLLECSPGTIRYWEKTGQLAAIKADGGARLFKVADLKRFKAQRDKRREGGNK